MPSSQGRVLQKHKFDPKGIPGVFAGYEVKPGMNWSRQYRVWRLETFTTQSLAFDARRPIRKLNKPQLTETVAFMNPIKFPLRAEYERINNTFEGMKMRELQDVEPEIDDPRKEIEYEEGEYLPSEPGALDHEELAERAVDDEPDGDQPVDLEMKKMGMMIPNPMMTRRKLRPLHRKQRDLQLSR